jgi:hypothetical protein
VTREKYTECMSMRLSEGTMGALDQHRAERAKRERRRREIPRAEAVRDIVELFFQFGAEEAERMLDVLTRGERLEERAHPAPRLARA